MRRRLVALAVAVGLLSSVVTGCAPASVPTVNVFAIALPAPTSFGAITTGLGMQRGANLAIDDMNASKEAKALQIRFGATAADDRGDAQTAVAIATGLVADPRLVGVVGHLDSTVSVATSKVYNEYDIVQVTPASVEASLTNQGFRNVFRVCPKDSVQSAEAARFAATKLGRKSVFVVDDATPGGKRAAVAFIDAFKAKGGKYVGERAVTRETTVSAQVVGEVTASGADLVYFVGDRRTGAFLAAKLKAAGAKAVLMGRDTLLEPEFIRIAGADSAEGTFATSLFLPLERMPQGEQFESFYQKRYPGKQIEVYDAYAYDAATVIMKAVLKVAKAKGVEKVATDQGRKAIIAEVAKTDFAGVTGNLSFDEQGDTKNQTVTPYTVQHGSWVPYGK